jgi:anti-sigma regulatory factor (Ser/Thr protein kinase)
MQYSFDIEGSNFSKAGDASSSIKKILKHLNIDPKVIKRTVVALYEAEMNIVAHAFKGHIIVDIDMERIKITISDEGPGIKDINLAMQEGFSTASSKVREMGFGAGMGLPNMKKNTDQLNITSEEGKGTVVEMITYIK